MCLLALLCCSGAALLLTQALHCYFDTATAPALLLAPGPPGLSGQPPNGLNVSFPAFVHLPAVLLNESALKAYLIGALKVSQHIFVARR